MIRDAKSSDATAIAEIYNYYVQNSVATFEEDTIEAIDFVDRICRVQEAGHSWLVAENAGQIIGYAYSSNWQERAAYKHTVEVTAYLSHKVNGRGWGTQLYTELFSRLRARSTHIVIAGITLPNPSSVALHEKFGMEQVAHFNQVGFKFGRWLDVGYWQVNLHA